MEGRRHRHFLGAEERHVAALLGRHFAGLEPTEIVTASREFPAYLRADLQRALDGFWSGPEVLCVGARARYSHETLTYASLLDRDQNAPVVAPIQFEDVDIGEADPVRCARTALWLSREEELRYAMLLTPAVHYGDVRGWHVEIAVPAGLAGERLASRRFRELEEALRDSASYRGKVLSLECQTRYGGTAAGVPVVQRLDPVDREDIILPRRTLELIERNVFQFLAQRQRLLELGLPVKKGPLVLRAARDGQDPHHPLSGRGAQGPHDAARHRGAVRDRRRVSRRSRDCSAHPSSSSRTST